MGGMGGMAGEKLLKSLVSKLANKKKCGKWQDLGLRKGLLQSLVYQSIQVWNQDKL